MDSKSSVFQESRTRKPASQEVGNNPNSELQMKIDRSARQQAQAEAIQKVDNKTGMPDDLKSGIENLSGMDMSDVKVHYNSAKPASVGAHAYAQGSSIHLGPGQEKHLAHEAWHTVQQKQGRVQPTTSVNGVAVNDSASLEKEADVMGAKAMQHKA
ncbi:MAG: DUF4157 domain-containing protein [Cytophagales bacterium]|nr:DUF4157 domain-containing protein [Cytophagales bacterium]